MTHIVPVRQSITNQDILISGSAAGDVKHRLGAFCAWLDDTGRSWHTPDLTGYHDELMTRLQPSSVRAHLSSVRAHYRKLLKNNGFIKTMYGIASANTPDASPADLKAMVDEAIRQIENDIDPDNSPIEVVAVQDEADSDHIRLTVAQANALMRQPGTTRPA